MSYSQRTKPLVRLIEQAAQRHSIWQVFSDFLEMSAISISKPVDPVHREEREKRYMETIKRYSREELDLFPKMFGELVEALEQCAQEERLDDILGKVFHELELHNKYKGQFFTPMSVCDMMGMISADGTDIAHGLEKQGYFTVCEPCVGSGAMILGMVNALSKMGVNYCQQMVVTGVDIDLKCVHMAYLQLSLYGIPAVVIHGNSLTCEEWSRWYTPVYVTQNWVFRQHCGLTANAGLEDDERLKMAIDPMYAAFRKLDALLREQPEPLTGTGNHLPETGNQREKMWLFFFEPRKEDTMGALYGSMTNTEINELARNLRETAEYEALLSLGIENGLEEPEVQAFFESKADTLMSEDEASPEDHPEDEKSPEPENPVSEGGTAVDKLRREAAANKGYLFIKEVTEHLISVCEANEEFAGMVALPHKTISNCYEYIADQVYKKGFVETKISGKGCCHVCGCDHTEAYALAEDYYRLDDAEIERKKAEERKAAEDARAKAAAERKAAASKKVPEKPAPPKKEKGVPDQLSLF